MKANNSSENTNTEQQSIKHILSKYEYDLYKEEDDVIQPIIRVKRCPMPNKGVKWKVMLDNKVSFVIEGLKLSKKEKEFLETVKGFNFILNQAKSGIKSFNSFKQELKNVLSDSVKTIKNKK